MCVARRGNSPKVTARTKRLKFPVRRLFPRDEPFSVPLIQLMLATDDVRYLQKLLIAKGESGQEASESERAILNGEIGHLFRLMCGHLYEAVKAFAALDKRCTGLLDAAASDDRARAALARVRQACAAILSTKNGRRSFIHIVRNLVGFHYIGQKLERTLDKHERAGHLEGTLVLSQFQGLGRYTVTDHLVLFLVADEIGGSLDEFQERYKREIGEAIGLAGALGNIVDYLIGHILERHGDQIEQYDEEITIDPAIGRAKEDVQRARWAGDTK